MKNCNIFISQISSYIDSELTEQQKIEFEIHMESCDDCRKEFEGIYFLVKNLNNMEKIPLPEDFHKEFMIKFNKEIIQEENQDIILLPKKEKPVKYKFYPKKLVNTFATLAAVLVLIFTAQYILNKNATDSGTDMYSMEMNKQPLDIPEPAMKQRSMASDMAPKSFDAGTGTYQDSIVFGQEAVLNYYIILEVDSISDTLNSINNLSGYNINSEFYTNPDSNSRAYVERKLNLEDYESSIEYIKTLGEVVEIQESKAENAYRTIDLEARIKAKTVERQRLINLLEKSKNMSSLNIIYNRVSQIDSELANLKSDYKNTNDEINNPIISINLFEKQTVPVSANLAQKSQKAFIDSLNAVLSFFSNLAIAVTYISIPVILIIIILFSLKKCFKIGG